jgi:hypothetical protein
MNSEEASKLQDNYARQRHMLQLAMLITSSTHGPLANSLNSSLTTYNWSVEDAARIRKIVIELGDIHGRMQRVETLSQPLMDTWLKPNSSPPTSEPNPMPMEGGDAPTSRPELPPLLAGSQALKRIGTPD